MPCFICTACGTQFPESAAPPADCPVCTDERQFVPPAGQAWTTLEALRRGHVNAWREYEPGLLGIGTFPAFGIGQRALLVRTPAGNVLWDCVALLDPATVTLVEALGGLAAIAISHPHFYTTMVEWSRAFGTVPVYLHGDDRSWVRCQDPALRFWEGERHEILPGLTLHRCGGHFAGSSVLHWAAGAEGRGALLTGDTVQVVIDRSRVSFMRGYPTLIPMSRPGVERIARALAPLAYDRIYGIMWDYVIERDAREVVARSVERYLAAIGGERA